MSLKYLLVTFLLIGAMAIPQAKAQLGLLNGLIGSFNIQGIVTCTSKDNMGINGAQTSVFSNAEVQLVCDGKVFSDATTNGAGMFSIMVDSLLFNLSSMLNGCNLVVTTPLSKCNSNLPSVGNLISTLHFGGTTLVGTQTVANITPSGFQFVP
ncbi:hypothetical protein Lal_00022474 [Lupinus albus]|uniref:Uncharacterized protein n=1 Tax=Lupinus albus TaxID=3870 RepID=A0A6A5PCW9_LUPAL|nr:hypothetical protein Lalb_Chr15g0083411 [Lupinus albus]KAF1894978.1 hypothetical protein Lal_00022474 [Lupinus albus]